MALDLASSYQELAGQVRDTVAGRIDDEYGLDVPQLFIVNISLPEEVEKALDTSTSMNLIGNMGRFQQYQMGQAMTSAAENPAGGGASAGMGLGMGFAMANQLMHQMPQAQAGSAGPPPPPPAAGPVFHVAENGQSLGPFNLAQLQQGVAEGRVTAATMVWTAGMAGWQPAGLSVSSTAEPGHSYAELAKKAGMKYIVITAKHHDGFVMWDTETTDYSIMSTPYGKDVLKDISEECEKQRDAPAQALIALPGIASQDGLPTGIHRRQLNRHRFTASHYRWTLQCFPDAGKR